VQAGPQDTTNKLRTAPLWGFGMRPRFIHDLRSFSLQNAIERHAGEAEHVRQRFQELSPVEKQPFIFIPEFPVIHTFLAERPGGRATRGNRCPSLPSSPDPTPRRIL